ncbi:hypothetical protein GCM10010992_18380 [Cloacibacterium rupense]|uniref:PsbP C-terminal domain-containing protein n=1 Tax=Cloacibacterium rupense TaxID=517423 RepID=A0ABQ2NKW7_9FLAO|nr:hypothetical protein [Cloacibacterium rupense]GGP04738.1 hypothetical protein GCM10010992_18380 [Cloacibacterium rupense]
MKKKFTLLAFLMISGFLFSQQIKEEIVGNPFKISYPSNYVKTYDLNDSASLQIMNGIQEKFTIIIQDNIEALDALKMNFASTEEAINFYAKELISGLEENNLKKISAPKNFLINGYNSTEITIEGQTTDGETKEKIEFFYLYTVIKTPYNYYQILSWSSLDNKKQFEEEFRNIAKSFKEIAVK